MPFTYPYPRPAVTVDTVVFALSPEGLCVLLIKRKKDPFAGAWAIPGGFVDEHEPLERAAARELAEETGLSGLPLEQIGAFGNPGRDPRGHTVSVAFAAFAHDASGARAADDAAEAKFFPIDRLPLTPVEGFPPPPKKGRVPLAFDHGWVLAVARSWLAERLESPRGFGRLPLVPAAFTLAELRRVHEAVLGASVSPREFRERVIGRRIVVPIELGPRVLPAGASPRKRSSLSVKGSLYKFADA